MSTKRKLWPSLAILIAAAGCAPAYHAYPCGCVPYGYCPDPPLPYTSYCGCPTPWAAKFVREHPTTPVEHLDKKQSDKPTTPSQPKNKK